MVFQNRIDAGRQLATRLSDLTGSPDTIVLGIPRGGVVVAAEVAKTLGLPLDVFLARKLGVPGQEELAFGAVTADGARYLDSEIVRLARLAEPQIERITEAARHTLEERTRLYRGDRPPVQIAEKKVVLVDDGIATGSSVYAAIRALRTLHPTQVIVAVPVAPLSTASWLMREADRFECVQAPSSFQAVGQFYREFPQLTDPEVNETLRKSLGQS